jgi:hypothetical protein
MKHRILVVVLLTGVIALWFAFFKQTAISPVSEEDIVMCTMDAMQCPDGSWVGRTGTNCEFVCPPTPVIPDDIQSRIDEKSQNIVLLSPAPLAVVDAPLVLSGQARGMWFFEADFPVVIVNWDGLIIGEGVATALDEWMTEEFVPFTATVAFNNPYNEGDPDFMKNGAIILQRDNPSGLPENDDALEIPIRFAQ